MKKHMKKFKILLLSNKLLIFVGFIIILYVVILTKVIHYNTKFVNVNHINGTVLAYKFDGDKMVLTIKGEEKTIVNYYFKSENEKKEMFNKIHVGDTVDIEGKMNFPNNNTIPNCFNYRNYLYNNKIYTVWTATKIEVTKGNNFFFKIKDFLIKKAYSMSNKEYYLTFILGDKSLITDDEYNNYQINGVAHLLAISGMHISLLIFFLSKILNNFKYKNIAICLFLTFFSFLTSFSPSVLRTVLYFALILINNKLNAKYNSIQILIITAYILIIVNPFIVYNAGFIYSFVISFGLLYYQDFIIGGKIIKIVKVSLISFIFSLPINILLNYEINFFTIFNNILFVPLISFIIFPLSIISFLIPIINPIFNYGIILINELNSLLSYLSVTLVVPKISLLLAFIYYFLIIVIKNKKIIIIFLLLIFIFATLQRYLNSNYYIYYLDVGQGDSILIIEPHNNVILIDTGGSIVESKDNWQMKKKNYKISNNLIHFFKSIGVSKINYFITTHGDYDHMGEAINLVNNFKVEKVIFNCGPYNDLEKELIKVLDKKHIKYYSCIKELNIDTNKLYFLQAKEYDNENDNSNVIYTELDGYKFMFMGDASITTEREILNKYNISNIDVLKVGHHGSKTSSGKEFINEINPRYSIISVGKNNRYGHPNKEVLENLEQSNIYRTDHDGSIMFKIKNNRLKIETCSP